MTGCLGRAEGSRRCLPLPGLPKAACVSHLKSIMCLSFYDLVGASSQDVVYLALPLYHMAGSLLGIVGCIGIGEQGWGPHGELSDISGELTLPPTPPHLPIPAFHRGHLCAEGEVLSQPVLG